MSADPLQIGDFRIVKRLGSGGMGIVYLAEQVSLGRMVALKVLGRSLEGGGDKDRFRREAKAVAALKHPGIASVHFIGQDSQTCFMAMEYIDGISLRQVLQAMSRTDDAESSIDRWLVKPRDEALIVERFDAEELPTTEAFSPITQQDTNPYRSPSAEVAIATDTHTKRCVEIVRDIALAMAHAHEQGVIHRDIKPENLMLDREGRTHIIDFGVARFFEDATLTHTGALVGTPMYMSPEQVTGRISLDQRTDIYSLGLVLYELLTLVPPITAPTREGVLRKIIMKTLPPVSWQNTSVATDLQNVVHKATSKDPDCRYQSAKAFADDLQRFLDGKAVIAEKFRYKLDESEISGSRPIGVIFVAFILFLLGLPGAFCSFLIVLFSTIAIFDSSYFLGLSNDFAQLCLFVPLILLYPAAFALLRGYSFGWWSTTLLFGAIILFSMLYPALHTYWRGGSLGLIAMVYLTTSMYLGVPFLLICGSLLYLVRKRTRDWFRLALQLRTEHKSPATKQRRQE